MKLKIYQVDAFTDKIFSGNPAAICPLESWLDKEVMQSIAMENNLAETAFYVRNNSRYEIRWFTPAVEVDLCGHATLAAAYVIFNHEGHKGDTIQFFSERSGDLPVSKNGELLTLNFPADKLSAIDLSPGLLAAFETRPTAAFIGKTDFMLVFESEAQVRKAKPNLQAISKLEARGLIITAKGIDVDFVSRFFAPQSGIDEDPVTGSAHTSLTPYWAKKLGKTELTAAQLSPRTGKLMCKHLGDRIEISGESRLYLVGEIFL